MVSIYHFKKRIMKEQEDVITGKTTPEKAAVVATPKPRKPRVSKAIEQVETTTEIPVAEENQQEPFLEEAGSLIELEPLKDKKNKKEKKKNKMKEKEKEKAKKAKAKEKAKVKAKKAKKAKKEKAKKAKVKAKAKEKKAKAKSKKAKKNKKNKSRKK